MEKDEVADDVILSNYELSQRDIVLMTRVFEYAQHPVNTTLAFMAPPAALRKLADEHERRIADMEAFRDLLYRIEAADAA